MVWMKDDMKSVKKKPKSFKAVYEDNPKGPTALKHPLMPWPPGTAKGESKGRKQDHSEKVKKKNDNMDEKTVQYSVDTAGVPYPRTLWEATVEQVKKASRGIFWNIFWSIWPRNQLGQKDGLMDFLQAGSQITGS